MHGKGLVLGYSSRLPAQDHLCTWKLPPPSPNPLMATNEFSSSSCLFTKAPSSMLAAVALQGPWASEGGSSPVSPPPWA